MHPFAIHDRRPVFVVGHPRSGTTLVQLLITAHPNFWSGPETHFFTHVLEKTTNWQTQKIPAARLPKLFERLAGKPGIELPEDVKSQIMVEAAASGIAAPVLLDRIMQSFRPADSIATRWLEKSPRHVLFIPQILDFFPDARIINIVRDPRDVVSSNRRFQQLTDVTERRRICIQRSLSWNHMVRTAKRLLPDEPRLMTIQYEALTAEPEKYLSEMMYFIGEKAQEGTLQNFSSNYDQVVLQKEVHKQLCSVGEIVNRRGVWKTRMSQDEAEIVETLCYNQMLEYDYTPEYERKPVKIVLETLRQEAPLQLQYAGKLLARTSRRGVGAVLRRTGLRPAIPATSETTPAAAGDSADAAE
jgi:hypothetical protein